MQKLLANPVYIVVAVAVLIALLVALLLAKRRGAAAAGKGRDEIPGLERLLREGQYLQAGFLAAKHEHWEEAIDYYLRAQEPLRAAQIAARTNNARRAAELYERGGDFAHAANLYEQIGMVDKAADVRSQLAADPARAPASRRPASDAPPPAGAPVNFPAAAADPARDEALTKFRAAKQAAGNDVAARARLQELGAEAAEALLHGGDIRRAAEVYRDAGLLDEAVHLYVNVLGTPGEAAPLLAAQGKHERAAELYEMAGQLERAASTWADVARTAAKPDSYIDRVERLSAAVAFKLLEEMTSARPPSAQNAELHYRFAGAVERQGDRQRAGEVLGRLQQAVGDYRDVAARLLSLRAQPAPRTSVGRAGTPSLRPPGPSAAPARPQTRYQGSESPPDLGHARTALSLAPGGAPLPDVEPPPAGPEIELSPEQISAIAQQVAVAAAAQARRGLVLGGFQAPVVRADRARSSQPPVMIVGLEGVTLSLAALNDSAAVAARGGPSIETLQGFIGGHPCELQNIEVFYRLGLAYLAEGKWAEALAAFDQVEEASPGYRDAERRAANLRQWQEAVGPRLTLAAQGGAAQSPETARYRIQGELGRGGMAVVYRAYDEVLGRDVALKFLSDELMANKDARDMFQREARSVAALNHPNIITIYDYGVLEGKTFICMEYVDGVSVQQMLEERGRLTVVEALRIGHQVLDGLEYAHGKTIIHRDIKPSNMMQTKTGLLKLMDFGLAKSVAKGAKASIVAGTPPYMPAEQISGAEVDHRADIFAVGCSLFEMLTGQLPFQGWDRTTAPSSVQTYDLSLPPVLDTILGRAMAAQPDQRYRSASEFNAPIRRILEVLDSYSAGRASAEPPTTAKTELAPAR